MVDSFTCDYIQYGSYDYSGYVNHFCYCIYYTSSFGFHSTVEYKLALIGKLS